MVGELLNGELLARVGWLLGGSTWPGCTQHANLLGMCETIFTRCILTPGSKGHPGPAPSIDSSYNPFSPFSSRIILFREFAFPIFYKNNNRINDFGPVSHLGIALAGDQLKSTNPPLRPLFSRKYYFTFVIFYPSEHTRNFSLRASRSVRSPTASLL